MRFLIIQTAFLGDVILATSVIEKLHQRFPDSHIDFLLRKGNEPTLQDHPFLARVIALDKQKHKLSDLLKISADVKKAKYDYVVNLHRFGSSGFITWRSGAKEKIGFDKNPFSFCYTKKIKHQIGNGKHEIERNHELIAHLTDNTIAKPKLYPSQKDFDEVKKYKTGKYICMAPASVWFTKQFPKEKWIELINSLDENISVYLIGGKNDFVLCEEISHQSSVVSRQSILNLAGKLSLLQTAALMKDAQMNYTNDSAPMHLASAMNAPVTAIFCSTIPAFGFGPLSDRSKIVETKEKLDCRPCGLHGYNACPKGHFKCALTIEIKDVLS
ncbi:MAG: glycosyltransferase family 9 protein [Bacteroidia bacterium]